MENKPILFTTKDIVSEAWGQLIDHLDLIGATQIFITGIQYNQAKQSGKAKRIAEAYCHLHPELRLFKHNFLSRGKKHWYE